MKKDVIPILWQDEHLLAINKPAGIATLPEGWDTDAPHIKALLEPQYGDLWIIHRLDKDTSGVLLLARSAEAHRSLNTQFEQRQVRKVYHALVNGNPEWETRSMSIRLRKNAGHKHRTVPDPRRGQEAETSLRVLERFHLGKQDYALVEARPHTGRTHQVRVHLQTAGHPLVGDALYGGADLPLEKRTSSYERVDLEGKPVKRSTKQPDELPRAALHAWSLQFTHPVSGETLTIEAPYPPDFAAALRKLRR